MPAGLKQTSSVIAIGFEVSEGAPNTFAQATIDLNLSPLDREVFVVQAIDLTLGPCDALAGVDTSMNGSITTTRQTAVQSLSNSNTLAIALNQIRAGGFVDGGVGFSQTAGESPNTLLEYIGIIATNDFFAQVEGTNNLVGHGMSGKVYGYRAMASADIYAALVQSEVLSA
jgi:hypothetical protein